MNDWWLSKLMVWGLWLLISLAILGVVLWLVRVSPRCPSQEEAEEELRCRYLEGEIDEEEYERQLAQLRQPK